MTRGRGPGIDTLKNLCRSMAMVEAILNPDGECIYSYNTQWSEAEEAASMRNGSGDEYDIVFAPEGAYIRGFDHESPLSPYHHEDVPQPWPGVLDSVPEVFRRHVGEPAFTDEDGCPVVTACLWRETNAPSWQTGRITFPESHPDPDGSHWLFELLLDPTRRRSGRSPRTTTRCRWRSRRYVTSTTCAPSDNGTSLP
ncbi:hypothetical protein [Streptomyces sp. NPDC006875]|uniref:hypothetical protein n=1 Tax=Streptomyces sp. NPDC006875 TaxID=3154781 RepID=UPI0033C2A3CE